MSEEKQIGHFSVLSRTSPILLLINLMSYKIHISINTGSFIRNVTLHLPIVPFALRHTNDAICVETLITCSEIIMVILSVGDFHM